ncbi:MAG: YwbE family protein [Anaerolineales bacterium]
MTIPKRSELHPGLRVHIIEKQNQRSGELSAGVVARILTKSPVHPHGIKVMLEDGRVGRVQSVEPTAPA